MKVREFLIKDGIDKTTVDKFLEWHHANQMVWAAFEAKALEGIQKGLKKWGAKGIAEMIRWDLTFKTGSEFKFNNNYAPLYARIFAHKWPLYRNFFEYRELQK